MVLAVLLASGLLVSISPFAPSIASLSRTTKTSLAGHSGVRTAAGSVPTPGWAWSPIAPAPQATTGAAFASDGLLNESVLFGGNASGLLSAATDVYDHTNNTWTPLGVSATHPTARAYAAMASDPSQGIGLLFGGETSLAPARVNGTTWVFDFTHEKWNNATGAGGPAPRADAAFAIDSTKDTGLLFGGWNPSYRSVGVLIYADTWAINLKTFRWTNVTKNSTLSPPPLRGARLAWDAQNGDFYLYGGCFPCTSQIWQYDSTNLSWTPLPSPSSAPLARMDAAWAWDSAQDVGLLFGGTDGTTLFNDSYLYSPSQNSWSPIVEPSHPAARSGAGSDWFESASDQMLMVVGGTEATGPSADAWRLSGTANLTVSVYSTATSLAVPGAFVSVNGAANGPATGLTNGTGVAELEGVPAGFDTLNVSAAGFAVNTSSIHLEAGAQATKSVGLTPVPPGQVEVRVLNPQRAPVNGAQVLLLSHGVLVVTPPIDTNATGWANYSQVPAGPGTVEVVATGYRTVNLPVTFPSSSILVVTVNLTGLPVLDTFTIGVSQGFAIALRGVSIFVNGTFIGNTSSNGWLNTTVDAFGPVEVVGRVAAFNPGYTNVTLPAIGTRQATLTLLGLPPGVLHLTVVAAGNSTPIADANTTVRSVGRIAVGPVLQSGFSNRTGDIVVSLVEGNYTFSVSAPGYLTFYDGNPLTIVSGNTTDFRVPLILNLQATVHFIVIDRNTSNPVANASVSLNQRFFGATNISGWLNLTDVPPAQNASVIVAANGYLTNITHATFAQGEVVLRFQVNLTEIPRTNGTKSATGNVTGLRFDTGGAFPLWELLLVPVLAAAGAALYLFVLRVPTVPVAGQGNRTRPENRKGPPNPPP
jgi:hypothetical protein